MVDAVANDKRVHSATRAVPIRLLTTQNRHVNILEYLQLFQLPKID